MTSSRPRIRLRSPADVLSAVPFLFGFHPTESLVVVGLKGKAMLLHARVDLPEVGAPVAALQQYGGELAELVRNGGADSAVLVGYGTPEQVDRAMRAAHQAFTTRRIKVGDRLRAHGGRYWSYACRNAICCPPAGTPFDLGASPVAAEAVFAGLEVAPDRESVVHSLDPPTGAALEATERASSLARDRLAGFFGSGGDTAKACAVGSAAIDDALERYTRYEQLNDDEVAWLSVLLTLIPVRDVAWARIDADGVAGAQLHRRLLTDLVRRGDPALAAPPAMLLGYLHWRLGDSVRAGAAIDRCVAADPSYSAGMLMAEVLDRAIPPWVIDRAPAAGTVEKPAPRVEPAERARPPKQQGRKRTRERAPQSKAGTHRPNRR
jgi:hypothetical protein